MGPDKSYYLNIKFGKWSQPHFVFSNSFEHQHVLIEKQKNNLYLESQLEGTMNEAKKKKLARVKKMFAKNN